MYSRDLEGIEIGSLEFQRFYEEVLNILCKALQLTRPEQNQKRRRSRICASCRLRTCVVGAKTVSCLWKSPSSLKESN
ncbi:hypothetical protein CANCADRAFT_70900 [Tortispora caseinolytica NRRL Y-17796]|uniref:Uncharacterized protein n=1 Tax=Tortispora caseinolytica NRRL Y-17796 TaxID=767744 RepID=A0A1E4TI76_9ASCO|nr:hypothetical protein CANCADRAFT_70900 [Tortispora caseinolytica NRRL Y-17796]